MTTKLENKTSKVNYFGIEVDPEITWNGWEPGNKYTKKLILKNVKYVTQKLNFSVPSKEVFTTTFPKTITLSAGTSFCLPITFKPHKKDVFEDKIDFQTSDGDIFTVPVKALLPQYSVDIPQKLSCGIVAAHDESVETFSVENRSKLETPFKWCFAEPYKIEPENGILQSFETMQFKIYFQPKDVSTYTMNIPFFYGKKLAYQKNVTVTSVAKYPTISIMVEDMTMSEILNDDGQIVIDFGTVPIGSTYQKHLKIQNASEINASVEISRDDVTNPIDWVFSCPISFSPVPAGTCLNIMIEYHPQLVVTNYVENFVIKISNKCGTFRVKCIGKSDGPSVSISHSSINFFQLNIGETATQSIILTNNSDCTAIPYQFITDNNFSAFQIDKCSGFIKPKANAHVIVTFRPVNPIQYFRKLVCLVPDQEPIFVDLLGTCHNIDFRPHILTMKHVNNFRVRQIDGLSYFSPEALMSNLGKRWLKFDENDQLKIANDDIMPTCEFVPPLSTWKDYFFSHNNTDIMFSTPYVDQDHHSVYFEGIEYITDSQIQEKLVSGTLDSDQLKNINEKEKKISLKNNTKGTISIQWTNLSSKITIFSIEPLATDIAPSETIIFTLKFRPDGPDRIYGAELEAFASFKSQRQFELVNERFISPPFCVLLSCAGHSFSKGHQPFQPRFRFDQDQVVFPSVNLKETAFRTLTLANKGDQPLIFNLEKLNESFSIKPKLGQILPGMQQIFVIRFEPVSISQYLSSIEIKLNSRNDFIQAIPLLGSADKAVVSMENNAQIFFNHTNIGNISTQRYSIKNTSRIPLKFEWKLRPSDAFVIRVYPISGLLLPNENLSQQWFFSPNNNGRVSLKALLMVQGISPFGSLTEPQYFPLRIIGQGEQAYLDISGADHLEFEPLVVGSSAYQTFDLINPCDATVYYKLNVTRNEANEDILNENDNYDATECLSITDLTGVLPGRCTKTIYVSARPKKRRTYNVKIGYNLIDNDSLELECIKQGNHAVDYKLSRNRVTASHEKLMTLSIEGVFPTLQITDVQGTGTSQWFSKLNLWKNLSLDNFNVCLDSDPTTSELIFTMATRASFHRQAPVTTRALIDMNLGAAPLNSDPTEIRLMFENCGHIETNIAFLFPEDLEIELEYWAETGEYTEDELHQMKIQDNKLFDIQPRKSNVRVGECVTVCISYKHSAIGTDRFPILFKLDHGRELLLNMTAVTLHPERCYIHFPSNRHVFNPTPIGLLKTPIQYYELCNAGAVPVHFELDISPLQRLMEDNYNIPILQCLNPIGDIAPGQTLRLEWIFAPIEPKTYLVEIPFHLNNGDCPKINFTAIGYDRRYLGDTFNPDQGLPGETGVPSIQSIELPNQIARLNVERLSIGTLPTFATVRRIIFLNNVTNDKNITFSWNVTNSDDANYVYIYPQNGRLLARESTTCHVILHTRNLPKFFDINLICEIYDEAKIVQYREEVRKWEEEESRRNVEFTITDNRKPNFKNFGDKSNFDNRKSSITSYLPPILNMTNNPPFSQSKSASDRNSSEIKNSNIWFKPELPKPFFLHLGITGRSCPIDEFQKNYPETINKQAIDKPSMLENASSFSVLQSGENETNVLVESHVKEQIALESILTDIIGSIIDDAEFLDAVKNLQKEAIPFYSQLPSALLTKRNEEESSLNMSKNTETVFIATKKPISNIANDKSGGSSPTDNNLISENVFEDQKYVLEEQTLLESLSFGSMIESLVENMIVNIMSEANAKEVDLTSRPRLIALPPRSARNNDIV